MTCNSFIIEKNYQYFLYTEIKNFLLLKFKGIKNVEEDSFYEDFILLIRFLKRVFDLSFEILIDGDPLFSNSLEVTLFSESDDCEIHLDFTATPLNYAGWHFFKIDYYTSRVYFNKDSKSHTFIVKDNSIEEFF